MPRRYNRKRRGTRDENHLGIISSSVVARLLRETDAMTEAAATARLSSHRDNMPTNSDSTPKPKKPSNEVTPATATNPSRENVECIDLTEEWIGPGKERQLGTVRKELEPPSAKKRKARKGAGGLKTTGLENVAPEEIIIIDSDDDDDVDDDDTVPIAASSDDDDDCAIIEVENASPASASLDDDGDCAMPDVDKASPAAASRPAKKAKVKNEGDLLLRKNPDKTDNEGVEIVEATAPVLAAATTVARTTDTADDDVVVEGVLNETRLPHMRQHCTQCPFNLDHIDRAKELNSVSCDLCYCYVCDCPVKECKHWFSASFDRAEDNHCCASDKQPRWRSMRAQEKRRKEQGKTSGPPRGTDDAPPAGCHFMNKCTQRQEFQDRWGWYRPDFRPCEDCWCYVCDMPATYCTDEDDHCDAEPDSEYWTSERQKRKLSTFGKQGPFKPDHPDASQDKELTKCRHCSWFIRRGERETHPSCRDWCQMCGLVMSEKDLEKRNHVIFDDGDDHFLGQKEIPFRIKAHDPRLFDKYKANWEGSEWNYDDAERDEEVFLHRIGKSPSALNILDTIPYVANDKVPNTVPAAHTTARSNRHHCYISRQNDTDAVIIENPEQLHFVHAIASIAERYQFMIEEFFQITASWDKESRSGVFKFRLLIPEFACSGETGLKTGLNSRGLCALFGSWFGVFPLQPSEICGTLKGVSSDKIIIGMKTWDIDHRARRKFPIEHDIRVEPYKVQLKDVIGDLHEQLPSRMRSLMNSKEINNSRLTLERSQKSRRKWAECFSTSSNSLRDSMVRFLAEHFDELLIRRTSFVDLISTFVGQTRRDGSNLLDVILGYQTAVAAEVCFADEVSKYRNGDIPSIKEIMIEIENLGHSSEDCVEGLQIELLEFQRQSLKWALEREQTPGGVQSFFWSKLPATGEGNGDIFFNPILASFRKDKPALVRGGFIAEQMGLGKTVISLALILKNPAPEFPLSGSPVSELEKEDANNGTSESCGWDRNRHKTVTKNDKTGSVISRGTLVICPVSLVGQWIEEARSKLKEPGLIYPYHGQNRKRDPNILASNSIVVTTYDIVASDAFRQTKKSKVEGYCPPLQQVRWWRVICDEGHLLRESKTRRSKAVLSLVADHKWIVSGTPMNTSICDLKNQLKFLGFEQVDKIFEAIGDGSRTKGIDMNLLMYFLRPIMMRHSQEQKYRGTSTTLMSLPPKTVRKTVIKFTSAEKKTFEKIQKEAQDWYIAFRSENRKNLSKHYLKIMSKLTRLRIACSGGKCPKKLNADDLNVESDTTNIVAGAGENAAYSNFVFQSKFKFLLKKLKKIRDEEPDSKSLVFSQFSSTLDWLKVELPKHGYQFRTLSGDMSMKKRAKALSDFQNDPPTTIFLLSMRAGAVGINLTQANRVFLMEPSFNPALEAQAIGRIHRLGQKRPVEILRLIVKDSFEERMVNFLEKKYGKDSSKKSEEASAADEKDSSDKKISTQAGNLISDKVKLATEEFDVLFGVKDRLAAEESNDNDDDAMEGIRADGVMSMGNV